MAENRTESKDHPFREPKSLNTLVITFIAPHNEPIIEENRIEQALRNATGVEDLQVKHLDYYQNK